MRRMSSVSFFARSSVPAPGVATGFDGAAALTAMPSSWSSAARLWGIRLLAASPRRSPPSHGIAAVVDPGRQALRHPAHGRLHRAVHAEARGPVELRERRALDAVAGD